MNSKDRIVTILLSLLAICIIVLAFGPIGYSWFSINRKIAERESNRNYRYVYAIPETSLFLQTYFYKDSLSVFVGNDTILDNCSSFSVKYFPSLTLVLLDVVNDSLVYVVDHQNDVDSINNNGVKITHISNGFDNHQFYDKRYTENSILYYIPKFPLSTRVCCYAGKITVGFNQDSVLKPMKIIQEKKALPR